ncbi:hypothetical protein DSO57_1029841 [Entomophthora muscae]|uniref:Uncharacterized protein n=1 Tax=Entomophthora muscae TaxID=34485 RepID=A0ACC2RFV4_9FUNG|nr:hypothetical protein DSO57_1029841 [Entomophthora muscae]
MDASNMWDCTTLELLLSGLGPMVQEMSKNESNTRFRPFPVDRLQMGSMVTGTSLAIDWDSHNNSSSYFQDLSAAKVSIDFPQSNIKIFFFVGVKLYKVQIAFEFIKGKVGMVDTTRDTWLVILTTHHPLIWSSSASYVPGALGNIWGVNDWKREINIPHAAQTPGLEICTPLSSTTGHFEENWSVWKLHVPYGHGDIRRQFIAAQEILLKYRLAVRTQDRTRFSTIASKDLYTPPQVPQSLTFNRLYVIECLVTNNLVSHRLLSSEFFDLISLAPRQALIQLVEHVWNVRDYIPNPLEFFKDRLQNHIQTPAQAFNPTTHALVRKVVVTPSKLYLLPPVLEESNRVLRTHDNALDRFLRVNFVDEGFNSIHPNTAMNLKLLKRVADVMELGITIARRKYEFLAFSSSQLKDHGCWFFSRGKGIDNCTYSADLIREKLGDFGSIHTVAKYAARIGQCFSSSRDGAKITSQEFTSIPDIECGKHCLTDGVGRISPSLMKKIAVTLELFSVPSAIQFRMGGYKGVLAVHPSLVDGVQLRPSQRKFDSEHTTLEVIRIASYNSAHLNRQIITLLTTLGVPDACFIELQNEMLAKISNMLKDPADAMRALRCFSDEFGTTSSLAKLLEGGFFSTTDCFVRNCLEALYVYQHNELKSRARIHVPKGVLLIGIADETGTLEEGEIFVQHSDPLRNGAPTIIKGECIVTRNPCFHPGDIRVVTAVDVPSLHHIKDCVVFSIHGYRSVASMCSGGDLDGDEFTVIWDKRLIPPRRNLDPMEELPAIPAYVESVSVGDIKKFFGDYISNDNLGQIANAHLARCDESPLGADDPNCKFLAQLHSRAVDFTKSGIPAELPNELRVKAFPDFMNKSDKHSYRSKKVLGVLYRSLDYVNVSADTRTTPDPSLLVPGFEADLDEAYAVKRDYDASILSLMRQYGIRNELEVVTGCVVNHRQMVMKRLFEVRRMVSNAYAGIASHFLKRFLEEFQSPEDSAVAGLMRRKAYAWYHAAYTPVVVEVGPQLESFGWIAKDYLIPIKQADDFQALNSVSLLSTYSFSRTKKVSTEIHIPIKSQAELDAENFSVIDDMVKHLSLE